MDGHDRLPPPDPKSAATMRRYDDLPADVRRAIYSAASQFHPQAAEKRLALGTPGKRVGEILKAVDHGCYVRTEPAK